MEADCLNLEYKCAMRPRYKALLKRRKQNKQDLSELGPAHFQTAEAFFQKFTKPRPPIDYHSNPIVTFGDIHGDFLALLGLLHYSGVIDIAGNWTGGATIVVQLGDFLDRFRDEAVTVPSPNNREELDIIQYLAALAEKAQEKGGDVLSVLGNHELGLLYAGSQEKEDKKETENSAFTKFWKDNQQIGWGGIQNKLGLFAPGGLARRYIELGYFPAILQLGNFVFLHAGLLKENIRNFRSVAEIQRCFLVGLAHQELDARIENIFLTRRLSDGSMAENTCRAETKFIFRHLGLDWTRGGICVAHQPQEKLQKYCAGKVWRMDLAMSEAFGKKGRMGYLRIQQDSSPCRNSRRPSCTECTLFNAFLESGKMRETIDKYINGQSVIG